VDYDAADAKSWARETLRDYFVTTTMPLHADLSIDEDGLRSNIARILRLPCTGGVYVGSIYQEFSSLTMAERMRVNEVALGEIGGRATAMVGVSGTSVAEVAELANHAQAHGADLVMIWPPTFGMRTYDGVLEFYRQVCERTAIGICLYSSTSAELGFHITPDLMVDLAKIDAVCAVKEASANLSTYLEALEKVGDRIVVSMPGEEYWLAGRRLMGPELSTEVLLGTSRPLFCETPHQQLSSSFLTAVRNGDAREATQLMLRIRRIANTIFARTARGAHEIGLMKAVTELLGMASGPVRPPLSRPTDDEREQIRAAMIDCGILADDRVGSAA
jgi:4-hydroxy-tetrahydrodipicolinate synthase